MNTIRKLLTALPFAMFLAAGNLVAQVPVNDNFENADVIASASGTADVDTSTATSESGEPAHYTSAPRHTLWWTFMPLTNGTLVVDTEGSVFDTVLALYMGSSLATLQKLDSNDSAGDDVMYSRIEVLLAAGTSYHIALDGYAESDSGAAYLNWAFTPLAPNNYIVTLTAPQLIGYPSNIVVTGGALYGVLPHPSVYGYAFNGWWSGMGGTGDLVTSAISVSQSANHALYAQFSPKTSSVTFDANGSTVPQQVVEVTFGMAWPAITTPTRDGYLFDGWYTLEGEPIDLGSLVALESDLSVFAEWVAIPLPPPDNDTFATASVIAIVAGSTNVTTAMASAEPEEPAHYGGAPRHTLWWTFIPLTNGTLVVDTEGSSFDTVLALYTGSSLSTLQKLASNDSAGDDVLHSRIELVLVGGTTYHIALDGYSESDSGSACLNWGFTPLPANNYIVMPTSQSVSGVVPMGQTARLLVSNSGAESFYQWMKDGVMLAGQTNNTLSFSSFTFTDSGSYSAVITNTLGMAISMPAILSTPNAPLRVWGRNDAGQLGNGTTNNANLPITVASNVVATTGGSSHSLFVKADGTLWAMGYNSFGQLGNGTTNNATLPVQVASQVVSVASGYEHSLFVKADGTLWAMGRNDYGQLGIGTTANTNLPVQVASHVVATACGSEHSLFVKADGTLWTMGRNDYGQLGNGTTANTNLPVQVASHVVATAGGLYHALFMKADGTLWAMGFNENGQLGNGTVASTNLPVQVESHVVSMASGADHALFVKTDATLWCMGSNNYGQLGNGTTAPTNLPVHVASHVVATAGGATHSLFVNADGTLWAMGQNSSGQLGNGSTNNANLPVQVSGGLLIAGLAKEPTAYHSLAIAGALPTVFVSNQTVTFGETKNFTASVTDGDGPFTYQWQMNGTNIVDATNGTYTISSAAMSNAGNYAVVVAGIYGSTTSAVATLTVNKATPSITSWPTASALMPGLTLASSTLSNGAASVDGAFAFTVPSTIPPVTASQSVTFTPTQANLYNSVTGSVSVIVITAPAITDQPMSAVVTIGQEATLSVSNSGTEPFGYQWIKDGAILAGQTNRTLSFSTFTFTDSGSYSVVITNILGMAISMPASLSTPNAPLRVWGRNDYGQLGNGMAAKTNLPIQVASNVVATTGGAYHSLFVKSDGTLWAMGYNNIGQLGNGTTTNTNRPIQVASNVVAAAGGSDHSLFVKSDGTLWAMGYNNCGQLGNGTTNNATLPVQVASHVVSAAGGQYHSLFVKADGTLWAMGYNNNGQLGNGTTANTNLPVQVASNVVVAAGGWIHSLFVKADGTLWVMGQNNYGQLGNGTTTNTNLPMQVASHVVAVASGYSHSLFVKADGTLWGMGYNGNGQLGKGTTASTSLPVQVASNVVAATGGASHSLFVKTDGTLWVMGQNNYGQLGNGSVANTNLPVEVSGGLLTAGLAKEPTAYHSLAIAGAVPVVSPLSNLTVTFGQTTNFTATVTDGDGPFTYQWQKNGANILVATNGTYTISSASMSNAGNYAVVVAGAYGITTSAVATLTVNRITPSVTTWPTASAITLGQALAASTLSNGAGSVAGAFAFTTPETVPAVGTASQEVTFTPLDTNRYNSVTGLVNVTVIIVPPSITAQPISAVVTMGQAAGLSVSNSGAIPLGYQWLKDGVILAGQTNRTLSFSSFTFTDSGSYSVVITNTLGMAISLPAILSTPNAPLRVWGRNDAGQLGNGMAANTNRPIQVASNVVAVAGGGNHSLFVKADGTLWAMGYNNFGQLGNGTTATTTRPVLVASNVVATAGGQYHSLFVKADGTLWAMGRNSSGQLGNGTTNNANLPVQVASNVVATAGGGYHSLFVKADGTLWAMGNNIFGQLGNGTTAPTNRPIQVASNVVATAGGDFHSLFVKADGTLWATGLNGDGQLGNGTTVKTNLPVQVASHVVAVTVGSTHSLFVKVDGTLWAMGQNSSGQLGNGTTAPTNRPIQVASNVMAAAGGSSHSLFVKADRTLWTMGQNSSGQLGNGTTNNANLPVQVSGGLLIAGLAKEPMAFHSLTIAGEVPTVFVSNLTVTFGQTTNFTATVTNGDGPFTYQWQKNGANIVDATNGTYTIFSASMSNASNYAVVVAGACGSTTSAVASLTVNKADQTIVFPVISGKVTTHTVSLSATASSGLPVSFSVLSGSASISGGTNLTFSGAGIVKIVASQAGDANWNAAPTVTNTFTVSKVTPRITSWPTASALMPGQTLASSTLSSGAASVGGAFAFTVPSTIPPVTASQSVTFTPTQANLYNSVTGSVSVIVITAPAITDQPMSAVVTIGQEATLSVSNSGTEPFGYQWIKDGVILAGQTNRTLSFSSFTFTDSGSYAVVITNILGTTISMPASLSTPNAPLKVWGQNNYGQLGNGTTATTNLPITVASNVVATTAGFSHSLFVKADGTLWAMGYNRYGQLGNGTTNNATLPVQVESNVVATTGGNSHSLFVKADGTLWAMGYNISGQLGNGTTVMTNRPIQVASNVVAVAAGYYHSLFVKADSTLWAMGQNTYGQLGNGMTASTNRPVQVASNVVAVAGCLYHSLFVKADGTLWAMGGNTYGQLGNGTTNNANLPITVASNVVAAAGGTLHSLFVKADGTLWAMGQNNDGQLGNGTTAPTNLPVHVASHVVATTGGAYHSLFVNADGTLWAMGRNSSGQLGNGTTNNANLPVQVSGGLLIAGLAKEPMAYHSLAIAGAVPAVFVSNRTVTFGQTTNFTASVTDGDGPFTYQWQKNGTNILDATNGSYTVSSASMSNAGNYAVVVVGACGSTTSAVASLTVNKATPSVTTWPTASAIMLGQTLAASTLSNGAGSVAGAFAFTTPETVPAAGTDSQGVTFTPTDTSSYNSVTGSVSVTVVAPPTITAQPMSAVVTIDQEVTLSVSNSGTGPFGYQWIKDGVMLTDQTNSTLSFSSFQFTDSGSYSLVITNSGGMTISLPASLSVPNAPLRGWGRNDYGQLGNGMAAKTNLPITVASNVVATAGGGIHSLFVKADGTLWTMGLNNVGQLGNGSTANTNRPIQVASNVVTVSTGNWHSLFVQADGTLWVMGYNNTGQLGNGTTTNTNRPVQVASNVVATAGGTYHSLFVKADGTLWSMGNNSDGQLGNGTKVNTNLPVQVASHVVAAAGGFYHSLFVKADGTLWAMGQNSDGQLGIGATPRTSLPVLVTSNVVTVASGNNHSLFVKADGTLWAMGQNNDGQLGNGTTAPTNLPVQVASHVVSTAGGAYHSLFVKADGTLWAMGRNSAGQLGNGTTNNANLPVQVSGGLLIASLAKESTAYHSLAIAGALPAVTLSNRTVSVGQTTNFTATVTGDGPFTYQWQMNGTNIVDATNGTYTISSAVWSDVGNYAVVVAGAYGSTTSADATLTVNKASQTVNFENIGDQLTTNIVALSATATSGLSVTNFSVVSGPAVISAGSVSFTNSGSVTLSAVQVGNADYDASPATTFTFSVTKAVAEVSLSNTNQTYDGTAKRVTVTTVPAGQTVSVTYNSSATLPVNAGSYTVVATISEAMYQGGTMGTLTIAKASQTVSFENIGDQLTTNIVALSATATSGLSVTNFSVVSGPAVISATSLSFTNSGSVTLSAVQVGNADYDASPATNISFSVSKALASVFLSNTNQTYDGSAKNVSVTTVPAGQTVETTYNSSATLPTNAGSYTVVATISEAMYQGGTTGTLTISKASQTVNFENIGDQLTTNIVALSATATSGLSVTNFSVVSGPAVISAGTNLTFSGAGIVKIVASQAGDANWNAAPTVTNTVTVSKATPSITSWPTASALMHGKTLAFSTLSSGAASVDGAFAFTVPNTIPAMTASQSVTFTPIDANRYNSVTGSVSVTVIAKPAITAQPISAVVTMGQAAGLSVSNSGSAPLSYQWLKDGVILLGQTNSTLNFASFKFVDSGSYSVVITNALGMVISVPASLSVRNAPLWAMGMNGSGQLGNGTTDSSNLPVQMASNVVVAACGGDHSLFVNADGTLWGMGLNYDGQLGNAMAGWEADLPVQVASNVVGVAAGFSHSLFVKTDGTLWAMGLNNYGQLGNGTTTSTNRPVQVSSNVVAVAAGYFHSLFVKADGTLWAMGWNRNGRLGNGTTVNARLPVQVASNVVTVASGNDHSLFVKADGTLWGMGDNSLGQLGVDLAANTTRPVLVMSNVVSAAAGYAHTLIIKADGTLWGMGNNYESELGLGVEVDTTRPVLVTNHVVAAAGGTYHSLFVKANGTLWGMGNNSSGQLGDGTWETTNQPVLVNGGGLIAVSVARGSSAYHSLAIASTLPMVSVSNLTVTVGQMTNFTAIVTGDGLFTYQWQFNGTNIVDATNDFYTISSAAVSDAGDYVVLVTGTYGTATSAIATLTVNKMSQTVNFPNIGDQFTTSRVTLIATASSGLSVTNFSVVSGPAVISAGSVSFTNSGSVTLSAVQDGDSSYSASPAETISFMVLASSYTLTVTSAHGGSDPAGTNSYDTPISVMITNSPIFVETTQYVCTGWTGTGSVPASGTTTNTGLFAMTQESTLVWLWTTNYLLKVETMGNGSVSTSNVWLACGTPFQISVTPDPYYHFAGWSGHAEGETSNPLTLAMNSARSVTANFVPNLTPNTSTPEYWLAQYGLTNFNTDALADADLDGMKTWQEYIAGTDPTNAASKFQITQTQMEGALGTNFVIRWSSVAGKLYAVDATTNLLEGFPLNRGRDILATPNENVLTIRVDRASQEFFRIRIQP